VNISVFLGCIMCEVLMPQELETSKVEAARSAMAQSLEYRVARCIQGKVGVIQEKFARGKKSLSAEYKVTFRESSIKFAVRFTDVKTQTTGSWGTQILSKGYLVTDLIPKTAVVFRKAKEVALERTACDIFYPRSIGLSLFGLRGAIKDDLYGILGRDDFKVYACEEDVVQGETCLRIQMRRGDNLRSGRTVWIGNGEGRPLLGAELRTVNTEGVETIYSVRSQYRNWPCGTVYPVKVMSSLSVSGVEIEREELECRDAGFDKTVDDDEFELTSLGLEIGRAVMDPRLKGLGTWDGTQVNVPVEPIRIRVPIIATRVWWRSAGFLVLLNVVGLAVLSWSVWQIRRSRGGSPKN